ncbi:MAG: bifunctional diguanylate cyclase/phosphodiesterase, partial [Alphaproteobacteria bacterium]|nr:bifunctional diguanylate cyclase/phosphodiesterase [Alphaproteobacteria bacterium]
SWLHDFYDADQVFVLDGDDRPLYAAASGVSLPTSAWGQVSAQVAPLLPGVRARAGRYDHLTFRRASGEGGLARGYDAAAFAMLGGRPVFVVVAPILPDFGTAAIDPRRAALLVSVYNVDTAFLAGLSRSVLVADMTLADWTSEAQPKLLTIPLVNGAGQPIAAVEWKPLRPFLSLMADLLPLAGGGLMALGFAGILAGLHIRQTSRKLVETRFEADHDPLTGLANRRRLTAALEATIEAGEPVGLLFADLDRFKEINDGWGHEAGDDVLASTGRLIAAAFPDRLCARIGGDEFVVMLPGDDRAALRAAGAVLLATLCRSAEVRGIEVALGGSVGFALAPADARSATELLRRADLALHTAKSRGKGRVVGFQPELEQDIHDRRTLEAELRRAIAEERIGVVYQIMVDAETRVPTGVEALARWRREDGRDVPPARFIPVAEESGLIGDLCRHVLRTACRDALRWGKLPVSVNLSPAQFRSDDIVADVRAVLDETRLPPERLRLEITEGVIVRDPETARGILDRLRDAGVGLALDDFGTGYSSLAYLRRFAFDALKLDRGFIDELDFGGEALTLVEAIVSLGHALGLKVVAEGVETERQIDLLRRAGCDELQGNLLGPPMARSAVDAALGAEPKVVAFPGSQQSRA